MNRLGPRAGGVHSLEHVSIMSQAKFANFLIILSDSANVRRMVVKTAVSEAPILNHG
jgi:hypothetical protein